MKKIRILLINLSKKSAFFRVLLRKCVFIKNRLLYMLYYFKPVDEKRVLFESFMGRKYVDSPKAIYEYMTKNK